MRPLEIPTQRIFNNSIKNQKLGSDPVLNHSTIVSSDQRPESKVQRPTLASRAQEIRYTQKPLRLKKTYDLKIHL